MFVKICGTTNVQDALLSVELGAEALGFIFAPSKRHVEVEQVRDITRALPAGVERVGVFTEPEVAAIARAVREAGLSAVQMHWAYRPEVVEELAATLGDGVRLWQVVGFEVQPANLEGAERAFVEVLAAVLRDRRLAVVLLDSVKGGASGGQGVAFPWARVRELAEDAGRGSAGEADGPRVVLAGGLHAGNVAEAIAALEPEGVDVVSGVEAGPGKKSPERLGAFFAAARGGV